MGIIWDGYRIIPKISPSMYKPPKQVTQKTLRQKKNFPPPLLGGLYLENCHQIQSKTKQKR